MKREAQELSLSLSTLLLYPQAHMYLGKDMWAYREKQAIWNRMGEPSQILTQLAVWSWTFQTPEPAESRCSISAIQLVVFCHDKSSRSIQMVNGILSMLFTGLSIVLWVCNILTFVEARRKLYKSALHCFCKFSCI